jgi:hypothetical protein
MWLLASLGVLDAGAFSADPPKGDKVENRATAQEAEEFKTPPGFVKKTRGKFVLYCKREAAMGTRIKTEACYDENQVREYLLALQQMKQDSDRIRSNCSNVCWCGNPESCSKKGP